MSRVHAILLALFLGAGLAACSDDEPGGLPAAPTGLKAMFEASSGGVSLSWTDVADDEDNYVVERMAVGVDGDFLVLAELPADTVKYVDTNPVGGKAYRYRVLAVNAYGESPSTEVMLTVP